MSECNQDIFIYHGNSDKPFANKLASDLERIGIKVWLHEVATKVGDSIVGEINKALDKCHFFAVVLSDEFIHRPWVQEELRTAMTFKVSDKLKILPILISDCEVPSFLQKLRYADFSGEYLIGFRDLILAVKPEHASKISTSASERSVEQKLERLFSDFSLQPLHLMGIKSIKLSSSDEALNKERIMNIKNEIKDRYQFLIKTESFSFQGVSSSVKSARNAVRDSLECSVLAPFHWLYCEEPHSRANQFEDHVKFKSMVEKTEDGFDALGLTLVLNEFKSMTERNEGFKLVKESYKHNLIDKFVGFCESYLVFEHT